MDFASIMAAEIASKKRKLNPSANTADASTSKPTKYLKRSEIEAQRQRDYLAQQEAREKERAEKAERKRKEEEEERARLERQKEKLRAIAERKRGAVEAKEDGNKKEEVGMTREELDEKLREMGEPIRLFGEDEVMRKKRLNRLAAAKQRESEVIPKLTEEEMRVDPEDATRDAKKLYIQLSAWFALVLQEWEIALASRPREVIESSTGRQAYSAFQQAKEHMGPLFEKFRTQSLDQEVFGKISEIVKMAQDRRYVDANDLYLKLSIGNA